MRGKKSYLWRGGDGVSLVCRLRWWRCGGGCGGVLAHGRRLQAAAAVLCFFSVFPWPSRFGFPQVFNSSFLFLCFFGLLSFSSLPSLLSVCFFSLFFFVFLSSRFSLLSGLPPSFSSFGFSFFFSLLLRFLLSGLSHPSSSSLSQRSWVLFIEPRAWLFLMGSRRLVGHWARLPRFGSTRISGRCVVGHCVRSVGSRREREEKFKQKQPFSFFPAAWSGGRRKRNSVVQNDTVLLFLFFFFWMYETASFWRKRAVSFKCGARTRQIPNQPLIIFFSFNCIPANFGLHPSCWPCFSL